MVPFRAAEGVISDDVLSGGERGALLTSGGDSRWGSFTKMLFRSLGAFFGTAGGEELSRPGGSADTFQSSGKSGCLLDKCTIIDFI